MMMMPQGSSRPPKQALAYSKARVFVGQLEPYVTESDLYPVFSCYGRILYLNVVRHSTTVTPNEERRIPTAFVWYETTAEADRAIAALHNVYSFSSPEEDESKKRYVQVSYADKSPQCTPWGRWQKRHAEIQRHLNTGNSNNGGGRKSRNLGGNVNGMTMGQVPMGMAMGGPPYPFLPGTGLASPQSPEMMMLLGHPGYSPNPMAMASPTDSPDAPLTLPEGSGAVEVSSPADVREAEAPPLTQSTVPSGTSLDLAAATGPLPVPVPSQEDSWTVS